MSPTGDPEWGPEKPKAFEKYELIFIIIQ